MNLRRTSPCIHFPYISVTDLYRSCTNISKLKSSHNFAGTLVRRPNHSGYGTLLRGATTAYSPRCILVDLLTLECAYSFSTSMY
jgi:hypothetical protein